MSAEIIAVGTEILLGDIVNTNAQYISQELAKLGFVFRDSKSNFIFASNPNISNVALFEALREADIYVRHFSKPERIREYLRISIGTDEEMQTFIDFVKDYLTKQEK